MVKQEEKTRIRLRPRKRYVLALAVLFCVLTSSPVDAALVDISGKSFSEWIFATLKDWTVWVICFLVDLFWPIIEGVIDQLPDFAVDMTEDVLDVFAYMNYWIALDVAFGWVVLLFTYSMIYIIVKLVIKAIPTVG